MNDVQCIRESCWQQTHVQEEKAVHAHLVAEGLRSWGHLRSCTAGHHVQLGVNKDSQRVGLDRRLAYRFCDNPLSVLNGVLFGNMVY